MHPLRQLQFLAGHWLRDTRGPNATGAYQQRQLRRVLASAATLPIYGDLIRQSGVDPARATIDDLPHLPILGKEEFRKIIYEATDDCTKPGLRYWATTGSTGFPLQVPLTADEAQINDLFNFYRSVRGGLRPTEKLCIIRGGASVGKGDLAHRLGLRRRYTVNYQLGMDSMIDKLVTVQPHAISAFPSILTLLAQGFRERGIDMPSIRLVFSRGETVTPDAREFIKSVFKAEVRDLYASADCGNIAYECPWGTLHVWSGSVMVEVERADGNGLGEAVITSLQRFAVPVVRYRLGDLVRLSTRRCDCGIRSQVIEYLEGRSNDIITLPSGKRVGAATVRVPAGIPGVLEYQTVQMEKDRFEVRVRASDQFDENSAATICKAIRRGCQGEDVRVEIICGDSIERIGEGKLRSVVSRVENGG